MSNSSSHNNLMRMHSPNGHVARHILSLKSKLLAQGCSQKFTSYAPFFLLQISPSCSIDVCCQMSFCRCQLLSAAFRPLIFHKKSV